MSDSDERGLQRLDIERLLPSGLQDLSDDERMLLRQKLQDQDVEIRGEILRKYGKSKLAEHDLSVAIDTVQKLDHDRKIYSQHVSGETGSGRFDLNIKGGDTKFIVPVLAVIGATIVVILLVLAMK